MSLALVQPALDKFEIFKTLGYTPHAGQALVHRSKKPRRACVWGVRVGKTLCASQEGTWALVEPSVRPVRGWCVAPTYDLCDKVFREIYHTAMSKLRPMVLSASESERRIVLRNLGGGISELTGKTGDNPDSLMGEGLDFCIVDECAALKPKIWERFIQARLLDKGGWALLISTPRGKGWFYDAVRRGQLGSALYNDRWESWRLPTSANPYIDPKELEELRKITADAVWQQEYEAEFIEGAGQVFRGVRDAATCAFEDPRAGEEYCAGLDLAKVADYTVLVVLDSKRRVVHLDRFNRVDWATQIQRIAATCARYNDAWTVVDSTGAGEPVYEALLEAGIRADGYPFTQASKSALVNNLAMLLERQLVTLPLAEIAPELIDELEAFQYTVTDAGNVKTGAPPGMHDDCAVALMLAAWAAKDSGEWEVQFA